MFSQHLLVHGLDESWLSNVLDNNPSKENKRLYGTNLICSDHQFLQIEITPLLLYELEAIQMRQKTNTENQRSSNRYYISIVHYAYLNDAPNPSFLSLILEGIPDG